MMKRTKHFICGVFFLFLFCFSGIQTALAQLTKHQKLDSLHTKWQQDSARMYRYRKLKFLLAFDTRNSFISANTKVSVELKGFQIGAVIHEHHNVAIGYYNVLNLPQKKITDDANTIYYLKLKMEYLTLFYEYIFVDTKHWEIGVPIEIGSGSYHTEATDTSNHPYRAFTDTLRTGIALFGAGIDVSYKIWNWLGLNAMGGYRFVGGKEPRGMNFNGIFYSVGIQVYFGELYKMAKFGLKRRHYRNNVEKIKKLPD